MAMGIVYDVGVSVPHGIIACEMWVIRCQIAVQVLQSFRFISWPGPHCKYPGE